MRLSAVLVAIGLAASGVAHAEDAVPEDGFRLGALPALNYNSDAGFGYGVIGTGYWYRDGKMPYKYAVTVRAFLTTKWVQAHLFRLDAIDVADLPLRLWVEAGYNATATENFCGYAGTSTCDVVDAEAAADAAGLEGTERDDFVRRYYSLRYREPFGLFNVRWRLNDLPHKVELMGGWRGSYYSPGTSQEPTPYEGSLYQSEFFPEGEEGFASIFQGGVMFDNRDNEPAPSSGYWSEASVRGASQYLGSSWDYVGVNVTLRGYVSLLPERVVSATRLVFDSTWGDLATPEMVRVGGSRDYSAFGGQYAGRGLRAWRYIGQVKTFAQQEMRVHLVSFTPGTHVIDVGVLGFLDAGMVARDWENMSDAVSSYGTGGGLRLTWNENFVVRVDAGFAPEEDWGSKIYINLDHLY